MKNVYKIGGKIVEIDSIHKEVHTLCKDYICGQIPDFKVETSQPDIDYEREKSAQRIEKKVFLSVISRMNTWKPLQFIERLLSKCYLMIHFYSMVQLLQWMRQAICSLQKAVRENPRTLACGENI